MEGSWGHGGEKEAFRATRGNPDTQAAEGCRGGNNEAGTSGMGGGQ